MTTELERAIQTALGHATSIVGALRDAQQEARCADDRPSHASARRIRELLDRAQARRARLQDSIDAVPRPYPEDAPA